MFFEPSVTVNISWTNLFNKDEVKNMVLNKIEDIDTFIKKLNSTWTNYF